MNHSQIEEIDQIARRLISNQDPSHDFSHAMRVMQLSSRIYRHEGGDFEIIIPAAYFHDVVMHSKLDPRSKTDSDESAEKAGEILAGLSWYPREKIPAVQCVIAKCSFSKNLPKNAIEQHIVQDADLLESLGAIAVARSFASGGMDGRRLHHPTDPAAQDRELRAREYAFDLFKRRLFLVADRLHTATAKRMAERRAVFQRQFYEEYLLDIGCEQ